MLITTTPTLQGQDIKEYKGIVSGETILGANIFRDFMAGITNVIGGRSAEYEASLREAKELAMIEMEQNAVKAGANAIVGVDIDYETIGQSMLMVSVSGTAVII